MNTTEGIKLLQCVRNHVKHQLIICHSYDANSQAIGAPASLWGMLTQIFLKSFALLENEGIRQSFHHLSLRETTLVQRGLKLLHYFRKLKKIKPLRQHYKTSWVES